MNMTVLLWLVAVLLAVFAGWQLWQAWRWKNAVPRSVADEAPVAASAEAGLAVPDAAAPPVRVADAAAQEAATEESDFGQLLEIRRLQQQLESQQQLVATQRARIQALQADNARLQQALERQEEAAPISPEYGEALRLAELDFGADEIAQRCGITVAEASLVLAMARRGGG